jgi:hypothetical protein
MPDLISKLKQFVDVPIELLKSVVPETKPKKILTENSGSEIDSMSTAPSGISTVRRINSTDL